jgi:hypothetical protein
MQIHVGDIVYGRLQVEALACSLVQIRDAALEQGAMDWAVILSHSVGVLNRVAESLTETT